MTEFTEITSYLHTKYHPKAILLHGSRVRGDAFDESDYDLVLISENSDQVRPEYYERMALDVSGVLPTEAILKTGQTPIWPCLILFDDGDGLGKRLAQDTEEAFLKGPMPLTKEEIKNRCNFSNRLIQRIQGRGGDPLLRFYYLGDFYQRVLRYWCELNQKWTLSAHLILALIAKDDPLFYQDIKDLWTNDYQKAALKIHQYLFKEDRERVC